MSIGSVGNSKDVVVKRNDRALLPGHPDPRSLIPDACAEAQQAFVLKLLKMRGPRDPKAVHGL